MANQIDSIVNDSRSVAGYTSVNDWPPAILAHWPTDVLKRGLANPSNSYFTEPSMTDSLVDPAVIDWPSATVEQLIHLLHVQHLRLHALSHLCLKRESCEGLAVVLWHSLKGVSILVEEVKSTAWKFFSKTFTITDFARAFQAITLLQKRESCEGLAVVLWHSLKGVSILVEEVKSTAWKFFNKTFTITDFARAFQAITLLQCVASHRGTKQVFLSAKVTESLYLFLVDMESEEHALVLRNASLRAIAALFEADDPVVPDAVHHFLEKDLIPLFLRCMEYGDLHSQWTATFIISKILMHEDSLEYISTVAEQCFHVMRAYAAVVETLDNAPSINLLNDIIQCYLRMLEEPRARDALKHHLPWKLGTPMFAAAVAHDPETARKLQLLLYTISQIQREDVAPTNDPLRAWSRRHHMIA